MRIFILLTTLFVISCNNSNTKNFSGTKWQLIKLTAAENNRLDIYEAMAIDAFQKKAQTNNTFLNFLNDSTVYTETTSDTDHYRIDKDTLFLTNKKAENDTFLIALHTNDSLQLNSLKGIKASLKKLP